MQQKESVNEQNANTTILLQHQYQKTKQMQDNINYFLYVHVYFMFTKNVSFMTKPSLWQNIESPSLSVADLKCTLLHRTVIHN